MGCAQPGEYFKSWPTQSKRTVATAANWPAITRKCVAEVAALVERLYLVRCQIAFFGGKQRIGHRVHSPVSLKCLRDRRS